MNYNPIITFFIIGVCLGIHPGIYIRIKNPNNIIHVKLNNIYLEYFVDIILNIGFIILFVLSHGIIFAIFPIIIPLLFLPQ